MVVVDAVDDEVQPRPDAIFGLEVEHHPVQPVLGQRPEQVSAHSHTGVIQPDPSIRP